MKILKTASVVIALFLVSCGKDQPANTGPTPVNKFPPIQNGSQKVGTFNGRYQGVVNVKTNGITRDGVVDLMFSPTSPDHFYGGTVELKVDHVLVASITVPDLDIVKNELFYQGEKVGQIGETVMRVESPLVGKFYFNRECRSAAIYMEDLTSSPPVVVEGDLRRARSEQQQECK